MTANYYTRRYVYQKFLKVPLIVQHLFYFSKLENVDKVNTQVTTIIFVTFHYNITHIYEYTVCKIMGSMFRAVSYFRNYSSVASCIRFAASFYGLYFGLKFYHPLQDFQGVIDDCVRINVLRSMVATIQTICHICYGPCQHLRVGFG